MIDEREVLRAALKDLELADKYEEILSREKTLISPFFEVNGLDLSGLEITNLPENFFEKFPHLFFLSLKNNKISELKGNLLHKNRKLRELDLSRNQLEELPESLISKAHHLQILDLSFNRIKELPDDIFKKSKNLKRLNLSNNMMEKLPRSFYDLKILSFVDLTGNRFPEEINKVVIDEESVKRFVIKVKKVLGE